MLFTLVNLPGNCGYSIFDLYLLNAIVSKFKHFNYTWFYCKTQELNLFNITVSESIRCFNTFKSKVKQTKNQQKSVFISNLHITSIVYHLGKLLQIDFNEPRRLFINLYKIMLRWIFSMVWWLLQSRPFWNLFIQFLD